MMKVITTVGTSIFTNYMSKEVKKFFGDDYEKIEDDYDKLENKGFSEKKDYADEIKEIKETIKNNWLKGVKKKKNGEYESFEGVNEEASAEIKSILKIYEEYKENIEIFLLTTDTIPSNIAAELVKDFFKDNANISINSSIRRIEGLQVQDRKDFEEKGLVNLGSSIYNIISNDENAKYILNITGGYKGVIPFLTIIGQLKGIEICYIFEGTDELLTIPQFPISFDWNIAQNYYEYLSEFNNNNITKWESDEEILNNIRNIGLLKKNGTISGLGNFFIDYIENNYPISKNIIGFNVEYKLYEYYIENQYKNYKYVEHSNEKLNEGFSNPQSGGEIDLFLSTEKNKYTDYISIEVKPFFGLSKGFEKKDKKQGEKDVKTQLENKINLMKAKNIIPKEFHVVIYTSNKNTFNNSSKIKKECESNLKYLKELVSKELKNCEFKTFIIFVELINKKNKNPYSKFMQEKLNKNNIKEVLI